MKRGTIKCWFARFEERITLGIGQEDTMVVVALENVAVLGLHDPPSYPPVAHVPIELIPEELRVTGTQLTLEVTGKPMPAHLRREGPASKKPQPPAEDDDPFGLDEAFG